MADSNSSCGMTWAAGEHALMEGEEFSMTCHLTFTGDPGWAPKMEWRGPEGIISDVIDESSGNTIHLSVNRVATSDQNGVVYEVKTYFADYNGVLPADAATNIPNYTYTFEFDPVIVHCESTNNMQLSPHTCWEDISKKI